MARNNGPAVSVTGLRELRRDLRDLDPEIDKELRESLKEAGGKVAVTAGAFAPRREGDLAHSIRVFAARGGVGVGSDLPYANVVHWGGTIRPRGVPITFRPTLFISRAVDDHMDELMNDVADGIEHAATRAGW